MKEAIMLSTKNMGLFDPGELAVEQAKQEYEKRMDIAGEMLITEQIGIYYVDIMDGIDTDLYASSRSILSWMNGRTYTYKGETNTRAGIVELYKSDHPEHFFRDGGWKARYLHNFIKYTCDRLTNKDFTKQVAKTYKRSMTDKTWFTKAVAAAGLCLLESGDINKLSSRKARETLWISQNNKALLEKMGAMIGRSTKTHSAYELQEELPELLNGFMKETQKHILKYFSAVDEETILLNEYREIYSNALEDVRVRLLMEG